jgi:hypothetical protein
MQDPEHFDASGLYTIEKQVVAHWKTPDTGSQVVIPASTNPWRLNQEIGLPKKNAEYLQRLRFIVLADEIEDIRHIVHCRRREGRFPHCPGCPTFRDLARSTISAGVQGLASPRSACNTPSLTAARRLESFSA